MLGILDFSLSVYESFSFLFILLIVYHNISNTAGDISVAREEESYALLLNFDAIFKQNDDMATFIKGYQPKSWNIPQFFSGYASGRFCGFLYA